MDKLVEQARAKLRAQHLRWTKQREMMLKIMSADPEHYQDITVIDDTLRAAYPGLSHDTIYRNLKEFERLGLVELRQHRDQMQVKFRCDTAHHHHFICEVCGRVQEIKMPPLEMDYYARQLPGTQITGHTFELRGICAECRRKHLQ
ncbi:Fur family transcriptional regulator [Limosilactobacillus oris]|uniref:Fur family transcriptional regulator n=1 Tax=Limosilactobacillus oris TaxID=1632 RepID=UPI00265ACC25|nr:Fur family transcriptional regulator [Limosilactobacillus oris]